MAAVGDASVGRSRETRRAGVRMGLRTNARLGGRVGKQSKVWTSSGQAGCKLRRAHPKFALLVVQQVAPTTCLRPTQKPSLCYISRDCRRMLDIFITCSAHVSPARGARSGGKRGGAEQRKSNAEDAARAARVVSAGRPHVRWGGADQLRVDRAQGASRGLHVGGISCSTCVA